ncbi:MAG: hypothetical protein ACLFPL_05360 [Candidatus Nanoarchaeia archaeon]
MFKRIKLFSGILFLFLFLQFSISFSLSCTNDFSNTQFHTQSGSTVYQLEDEDSINVINYNLSSHPLTIYMQKTANESGCFQAEDFAILEESNTLTSATGFDESEYDDGDIEYIWTFELSLNSIITQQYVDRNFIYTPSFDSSDVVNEFLYIKVDRYEPSIDSIELFKDSQSFQVNTNSDNSQGLQSSDEVQLQINGVDDISIKDISISSIQGGEVISSSINAISQGDKQLTASINLTQSPLNLTIRILDQFNKVYEEDVGVYFDSREPSVNSVDITSYELTNSLDYIVIGEVIIEDDFPINQNNVEGRMTTPSGDTVGLSIISNSCEQVNEDDSSILKMSCQFRSEEIDVESTYTSDFRFIVTDEVSNVADEVFSEEISIDTDAPEVLQFEVVNPLNNSNIISPHVEESSYVVLRVNNPELELYRNVAYSSSNSADSKIRIIEEFDQLNNELERECELLESDVVECRWEITQDAIPDVDFFNLSLNVIDIAGNGAQREIEIEVDNTIPQIESLELKERGNERNGVFESSEKARMELILDDVNEREEIQAEILSSAVLFQDSMQSIQFDCYFEPEEETQVCFTDDFNLNKGFEGNRSEPLEVAVSDRSGNNVSSSIDVKIFKVAENESIDYFEFEDSEILSPLNRRLVNVQGVDVYHKFNLRPKNNNEEYKILQIELLGMSSSGDNGGEEVRLTSFELQNQTSLGVVRGDNREYFLKSLMPQLLSLKETEDDTTAKINISIVKIDEDTVYRGETLTVDLPIEFYDMPRDINSNIATVEKLLDDINGISDERKNKESLLDIYMMYYDLCNSYNSIKGGIHSVSKAWFLISVAMGNIIPTSEPIDEQVGRTSKLNSMMGNIEDIIGKVCMLATCQFSQEILGGALDSATNSDAGSYLTGRKSFLGNMICKVD